jgi:hypothetical protein
VREVWGWTPGEVRERLGENRRNKSPGERAALEQHGELAVYGDKQCEKSASWQEKGILG